MGVSHLSRMEGTMHRGWEGEGEGKCTLLEKCFGRLM